MKEGEGGRKDRRKELQGRKKKEIMKEGDSYQRTGGRILHNLHVCALVCTKKQLFFLGQSIPLFLLQKTIGVAYLRLI